MTIESSWFQTHPGTGLAQGDLLLNCPRLTIAGFDTWPPTSAGLRVQREDLSAIILTQSCDLEQEKVEEVLLARVRGHLEVASRGTVPGAGERT